jgi:hypothetical protein
MGLRAGAGTGLAVSVAVLLVGVLLVRGEDASAGTFGWVLIVVGLLFGALNLLLLTRGR